MPSSLASSASKKYRLLPDSRILFICQISTCHAGVISRGAAHGFDNDFGDSYGIYCYIYTMPLLGPAHRPRPFSMVSLTLIDETALGRRFTGYHSRA